MGGILKIVFIHLMVSLDSGLGTLNATMVDNWGLALFMLSTTDDDWAHVKMYHSEVAAAVTFANTPWGITHH